MTAREVAAGIGLDKETAEQALSFPLSRKEEDAFRRLFDRDQGLFEQRLRESGEPFLLALALYLRWAVKTWEDYKRLGISPDIFWDTFRGFALWSRACREKNGRPGIEEWGWNAHLLRLEVFRIGRLEYQPRLRPVPIRAEGRLWKEGTPSLEIHVPAGAPLTQEALRQSLLAAPSFFASCFGFTFPILHCHSWLLSAELRELLPPNSGILQFQSLFTVYGEDYDYPQAEERVFGGRRKDPSEYPEDTRLQRALKRSLTDGKQIGMGMGIIRTSSLLHGKIV